MSLGNTVTVSTNYQITLPEDICQELGIKPEDELFVTERGGEILLIPLSGVLLKFPGLNREEIIALLSKDNELDQQP